MSDLTFYDAAFPPEVPPETDGVCVYVGGDATHVWTLDEIRAQKARYRLPVFVRSNPRGIAGVAADVNAALAQLKAIGAPRGILVAWDLETAADKTYIAGVYTGLAAHGYELIIYGSESTVMGNDNPDGLYFGADWTNHPHLAHGDAVTQWVSFSGYDLDLAESSLPFWDTQAKPPKPPVTKPTPAPLPSAIEHVTVGESSLSGLATEHHTDAGTILALTLAHSGGRFATDTAAYVDGVFGGAIHPEGVMPAGLVLYLPG